MDVLRLSDYKRMPWKNDGGVTLEIAVLPSASSAGDFDWRISMATVAADGPFSVFPAIKPLRPTPLPATSRPRGGFGTGRSPI
jgi:environmental stress-induced protein Ves